MAMRTFALLAGLAFAMPALPATSGPTASVTPVQAELMAGVYAHKLRVGSTVFARVTEDWRGGGCTLDDGAILEGHVVSVVPHSKTAKVSELDLAFTRAQCGQPKLGEFELRLAAIAAPLDNPNIGVNATDLPIQQGPAGMGTVQTAIAAGLGMDSGTRMQLAHMKMGEVLGIKGVKLSVGTGPESSTVLTLDGHDLSLEEHTTLLLIPPLSVTAHAMAVSSTSASTATSASATGAPESGSAPVAPPPPPLDDIDTCEPPQCSIDAANAETSAAGASAGVVSLRELGYAPRPQRAQNAFDHDEEMAYLAPRQLLVAFNPHILAPRHTLGPSGPTLRVIRAVLVNTQTHRILRTVDWELPDLGEYLWPLRENRALVHVGSELRVYGEGLKILKRIPVDGPLAFLRSTPDGKYFAVGIIRERHTPELHVQLRESLGHEPDEDVDILILNHNFERIASARSRSDLQAPTMLNEGQAKLLAQPEMRYRIALKTWDSQNSTLLRFVSSCTPEISSIGSNLIFLSSCDKQTSEAEFRILHTDAKLALKSIPKVDEFGFAAKSSGNGQDYVVKIVQTSRPILPGTTFSASDLTGEELRVYRTVDGKRLVDVHADSPSASRDGFALAPDGSELAVLTRDQIAFYSVPAK